MANINIEDMLDKVKSRIDVEGNENDITLRQMLEDAVMAITLFCNRKVFPWQLEYIARQMVVNVFQRENGDNVAAIKRGDTQITYTSMITQNDMTQEQKDICCKFRRFRTG